MADREKVLRGLEMSYIFSNVDEDNTLVPQQLVLDTIALLIAQGPVEPRIGHDGWYRCGGCNNPIASGERVKYFYGHPWPKYCEECGRAVKWE